ncbi:MAG: MarR family transcriptional regulator [Sulfuricella sp.]|nr:MarR family transcriptional regulator [Sulfuricella sp.]
MQIPESPPPDDEAHQRLALAALGKFREVLGSVKRHVGWVEEQCGLSGTKLWALHEIQKRPGLKVTELAQAMSIHQSTASNLVDKLIKRGLIRRDRSSDDQRVVNLTIADEGEKLLAAAPLPPMGVLPDALVNLPEPVLRELDANLGALIETMKVRDAESALEPLSDAFTASSRRLDAPLTKKKSK